MSKSDSGRFFEDFTLGEHIHHATPRTLTDGDVALNLALTGSRLALFSSDEFANSCGLGQAPIDPLLAFHVIFGKSVPDISKNAVANLGYAEGRFFRPIYPGDTIHAISEVIGLKENSAGDTGVVFVRTQGLDQAQQKVLSFCRWVMVKKRDPAQPAPRSGPPNLNATIAPEDLILPDNLDFTKYNFALAGSPYAFEDYAIGEKIDHMDGMTLEEAEHQLATRLYQNTARVHFDAVLQKQSRFGQRLIYGGVIISLARALSFNGLGNAAWMLAINGGRHVSPVFAGDTIYAWSEILDKTPLSDSVGALRLRLVGLKNQSAETFSDQQNCVLDFDFWAAIPRRT